MKKLILVLSLLISTSVNSQITIDVGSIDSLGEIHGESTFKYEETADWKFTENNDTLLCYMKNYNGDTVTTLKECIQSISDEEVYLLIRTLNKENVRHLIMFQKKCDVVEIINLDEYYWSAMHGDGLDYSPIMRKL